MIPKGPKGPFRCLGGDKMMNLVIHIIAGNLRSVGPPKEEWPQLTKGPTSEKVRSPTDLERNQFKQIVRVMIELKRKFDETSYDPLQKHGYTQR